MSTQFCFRMAAVFVIALIASPAALASPPDTTVNVNCDAGRHVADAIDRNVPAGRSLIIIVRGTCAENVTIERDNVVLRADPSGATISAPDAGRPAIRVDGARHVALEGLVVQGGQDGVLFTDAATGAVRVVTVRNAARDGVRIERGSNVVVDTSVLENNGESGLSVNASHATVTSSTTQGNGYYGVRAILGASVRLGSVDNASNVCCGNTVANNNSDGVLVIDNSTVDLFGNTIDSNGASFNRFGLLVTNASTAWLRGGNVLSHNGGAVGGGGIYVRAAVIRVGGGDFPVSPQTNDVTANRTGVIASENAVIDLRAGTNVSGNTFNGLLLDHGTRGRLEASTVSGNNAHGLFVIRDSSVSFQGASNTVSGNAAFGLYCADGESSYSGNTIGVTGNGAGDVNCTGF